MLLFIVYCFPYSELGLSEGIFNTYIDGYARVVGSILRLFEPGLVIAHNQLHGRFSIQIAKSCDAVECHILLVSALLALPGPWPRKLLAVVFAAVTLAALNVLRIVSLYYVGLKWHAAFDAIHSVVWPLALILFTCLLFLAWARRVRPDGAAAAPRPAGDHGVQSG